jgi:hypothetical protein
MADLRSGGRKSAIPGRLLCGLLAALLVGSARAQEGEGAAYCNVTKVTVKQFSNMVRVELRADGVLRPRGEWRQYFSTAGGDWDAIPTRRFTFRLTNARSKVGSFVNIGKYPISHLELTVPPEAEQGIGLDVAVVTYRLGELRRGQMPGLWEWMPVRGDRVQIDLVWDQDQRGITIRGLSDRSPHAAEREQVAAEAPKDGELAVTERNGGIKLMCVKASRPRIFQEIGRAAGVSIAVGPDVQGYGSACLPHLPPDRLLRTLCEAWGLALSRQPGGYTVRAGLARSASSHELVATLRLPVRNMAAQQALDALPNFLERNVFVDALNNDLVVTGPPVLVDKIRRDLSRIDRPPPSIELRASVVESRRTLDWEADLGLEVIEGDSRIASDSSAGSLFLGMAEGWPEDVQVRLRALSEAGDVTTRSAPALAAANGEEAQVFVGERQFYTALTRWRRQEVTLRYADVGVRLYLRPWTGDCVHVTVPMYVEANRIIGKDDTGSPRLRVSKARGTLRVQSGDTIFVGGLNLTQDTTTRRRVPILGQLPLVGSLLSSRTTTRQTSELALFLTARAMPGADTASPPVETDSSAAPPAGRPG